MRNLRQSCSKSHAHHSALFNFSLRIPPIRLVGRGQHPAAHLVQLHRLEQRLEVAFAKAFVAFALDELKEDRAQLVLAEDLQQQTDRKFNRMRPSMARVLGLETRSAKTG